MNKHVRLAKVLKGLWLVGLLFFYAGAEAHSPHDVIGSIAFSPSYEKDNTLYISILSRILMSTNRGASWVELSRGLDNRDPITSILVPGNGQILYLSTDGDGIYESQDRGHSWRKLKEMANQRIALLRASPVFDRDHGLALVKEDGTLYISHDAGVSWAPAPPLGEKIVSAEFMPNRIYVGTAQGNGYGWSTGDASWRRLFSIGGAGKITALKHLDGKDDSMFVGTEKKGLFRVMQEGNAQAGYEILPTAVPGYVTDIVLSPTFRQNNTGYVTTWHGGVYRSTDGGRQWVRFSKGLTTNKQADKKIHFSPQFRGIAISPGERDIFVAGFDGLFRNVDGKNLWEQLETRPVSLIKRIAAHMGKDGRPVLAVAAYGGGAYLTKTDGRHWDVVNKGLTWTRLTDLAFSPDYDRDHILWSGIPGYIIKLTDVRQGWKRIQTPSPNWRYPVARFFSRVGLKSVKHWLLQNKNKNLLPFPTAIRPSPDFVHDRKVFFGTRWHGLYKLNDRGGDIDYVWGTRLDRHVSDLAFSPDYRNDRTIFATFFGKGVFKSSDAGRTWKAKDTGIRALLESYKKEKGLYRAHQMSIAVSPAFREDGTVFLVSPQRLFVSTDRGESWTPMAPAGLPENPYIRMFMLSPHFQQDREIFISLRGFGVYRSQDAGKTFQPFGGKALEQEGGAIEYGVILPAPEGRGRTMYLASEMNILVTHDEGASWNRLPRLVRYEESRAQPIKYKGGWKKVYSEDFSARTEARARHPGDSMVFTFAGTSVKWIGSRLSNGGNARVYLDGKPVATVDTSAPTDKPMEVLFEKRGLSYGMHRLKIELPANGKTGVVAVDGFDVDI